MIKVTSSDSSLISPLVINTATIPELKVENLSGVGAYLMFADNTTTDSTIQVGVTGNTLQLKTNSTLALTLDNSQNAIFSGTVSGLRYLATSSSVGSPAFQISANAGMYNAGTNILGFSTASTSAMIIDNSQNVGIGSVPADSRLDVTVSGATRVMSLRHTGSLAGSTTGALQLGDPATVGNGTGIFFKTSGEASFSTSGSTGLFKWYNNSALAMTLTSAGALTVASTLTATGDGVLTGSPVTGTSRTYVALNNTSGQTLVGVESSVGQNLFNGTTAYSTVLGSGNATSMHLCTNNNSRITITSGGNVSIDGGTLQFNNNANILWKNSGATARNIMTVNGSNVLFMTGADSGGVQLCYSNGNVSLTVVNNTSTGIQFNNYGAGTLSTNASGVISATSDARMKEDIQDYSAGLDQILLLSPKTFKWKTGTGLEDGVTYAGFIAQEVQPILPEAIGQDNQGMLSFSDRPILAALVNAIKELKAQFDAYKTAHP